MRGRSCTERANVGAVDGCVEDSVALYSSAARNLEVLRRTKNLKEDEDL